MDQAPPWLAVDHILNQFAPDSAIAQAYYRAFVAEKIGDPRSPWEGLISRLYFGSESWLQKIKERIESNPRSDDHPREQRQICGPEMAKIIPVVAEVFAVKEDEIRHGHGGVARGVAAWLGWLRGDPDPTSHRRRSATSESGPGLRPDPPVRRRPRSTTPASSCDRSMLRTAARLAARRHIGSTSPAVPASMMRYLFASR
jgi:hypothetical protein